jgi:hypothetical protein
METKSNTSIGAFIFVWLAATGAIIYFDPLGDILNYAIIAIITILMLAGNISQ